VSRSADSRNRLAWILLGIVVAGAVVFALWPRSGPESTAAHTKRLAREFRCVDCEGLSVADSHTASARAARAEIQRRIAAGDSDAEIRGYFVDLYGESVLLKPQGTGIGLIVWALPVAALILGGAGIVIALRRWKRAPRLQATDDDEALVARALEEEHEHAEGDA
jgi:cytochrome c-type biogenesis protein CcmH